MKRVSLDERLRALDPTRPVTNRIQLMGMTLQGFVNMLRNRVPDCKQGVGISALAMYRR